MLALYCCITEGFEPASNPKIVTKYKITAKHPALKMSSLTPLSSTLMVSGLDLAERLGVMPLCLEATSKTTTFDDPTAGMTSEEITNYVSNVGGGMCGAPEVVRTAIGLGLNFSLLFFGLFTISYVVLSGANFALEKSIEDSIRSMDDGPRPKGQPSLAYIAEQAGVDVKGSGPGLQASLVKAQGEPSEAMKRQQEKLLNGDLSAVMEADNATPGTNEKSAFGAGGMGKDGQNRDQRRLNKKIK